jgi:signal peptidase I
MTTNVSASEPEEQQGRDSSGWLESIQSLLVTVVIAVFVISFVAQAFQIPSESMEETLLIGDYLLVDKLHFGGSNDSSVLAPYRHVQRGDIVVFHYPVDPSKHFVKRVIGLPKDRIRLVNKQVWVNGAPLHESYVHIKGSPADVYRDNFPRLDFLSAGIDAHWVLALRDHIDRGELVVPPGNYFVMGDNRDDSSDSRYWGFVPEGNIIGRPLMIYWSIRSAEGDLQASATVSDRIIHFLYVFTHLLQVTRWDRMLRVPR